MNREIPVKSFVTTEQIKRSGTRWLKIQRRRKYRKGGGGVGDGLGFRTALNDNDLKSSTSEMTPIKIGVEEYKKLVEIAKTVVRGSAVHALDVVHDAILKKGTLTIKDLRSSFYSIRRANQAFVGFAEPVRRLKSKVCLQICNKCRDTLPSSHFTYKDSKGHHYLSCDYCIREKAKQYYHANKEKCKERRKIYYQENKDKELRRVKKWYEENQRSAIERIKKWSKKNPDKVKLYNSRRKKPSGEALQRRRQQVANWKKMNREKLRAYQNNYYAQNKARLNAQERKRRQHKRRLIEEGAGRKAA